MFRKAWRIFKALLGRQDGRVPADPELHFKSFGGVVTSAAGLLPAATHESQAPVAATEAASTSDRTPAAGHQRRGVCKPSQAMHAQRLASVAKLNRPVSTKAADARIAGRSAIRSSSGNKRKARAPAPQAWIIAGRQKKLQDHSAKVVAFPAARARSQTSRKAAA